MPRSGSLKTCSYRLLALVSTKGEIIYLPDKVYYLARPINEHDEPTNVVQQLVLKHGMKCFNPHVPWTDFTVFVFEVPEK